jgi:hypothetical protein
MRVRYSQEMRRTPKEPGQGQQVHHGNVPGSRLLPTYRTNSLQSGSPPWRTFHLSPFTSHLSREAHNLPNRLPIGQSIKGFVKLFQSNGLAE